MHGGQQIMNINTQAQRLFEQEKAAKEDKAKRTAKTVDIGQAKGVTVVQ